MYKLIKNQKKTFFGLFLLLIGFLNVNIFAQTITIGTQGANTTQAGVIPYIPNTNRHFQVIYTLAEINAAITAAGGTTGLSRSITSLAFDVSTPTTEPITGMTIKATSLGVATSIVGGFYTGTFTTVKNSFTIPIGGTVGFTPIIFDTSFDWDGASSILFEFCTANTAFTGTSAIWTYTGLANQARSISNPAATPDICTLTGAFATTTKPRVQLVTVLPPACVGTPVGGTTTANNICGSPVDFGVAGATFASGLTYQWEYSSTSATTGFAPIATQTAAGASILNAASGWYRRQTICGAVSTPSIVYALTGPNYFPVTVATPFSEDFELSWSNVCDIKDAPTHTTGLNYWRNTPGTGNASWRRQDEFATANWTFGGTGAANPNPTDGGIGCANFSSYSAGTGQVGSLDVYLNLSSSPVHQLNFSFANNGGTDPLVLLISTDGGLTFNPLQTYTTSVIPGVAGDPVYGVTNLPIWTKISLVLDNSQLASPTNATTIIRFRATSDFGFTNIGLDNVFIKPLLPCFSLANLNGGVTQSTVPSGCAPLSGTLSVNAGSDSDYFGFTYQWQSSIDNGVTWVNIATATSATYNLTGLAATTRYRRLMTCTVSGATGASSVLEVKINTPSYALPPFTENFETGWINVCAVKDVPPAANGVFYWKQTPPSGATSWRRQDEFTSAGGWGNFGAAQGLAPPDPTDGGIGCANFNSTWASNGTPSASFDLYANLSTAPVHRLNFGYVNNGGSDKLRVFLSTDGGTNFSGTSLIELGKTRAASPDIEFPGGTSAANCYSPFNPTGPAAVWTKQTILIDQTQLATATSVIRFRATADFGWTNIAIDNVNIQPLFPQDAGISKINLVRCSPRFANVQVEITNYGFEAITNFPVGYTLDGGTQITEIFTGTIDAYKTAIYTFVAPVDLTLYGASININSTTLLIGDGNSVNNALAINIAVPSLGGGAGLFVPYSENFNAVPSGSLPAGWAQPASASNWFLAVANTTAGIGTGNQFPNDPGSFGNPIVSAPNGTTPFMAVDDYSRNGLPLPANTGFGNNRNAYLIAPAFNFTGTTGIQVRFTAFFERFVPTPTFSIKASLDNGSTWAVLPGGTITSNTWTNYTINLPVLYENRPSVLIAFHYDDGGVRGEGCAVDNFSVTGTLTAPPVVQATFATPVVPDRYVERGTVSHPIYKMSLRADASSDITLSDFIATTAGTYQLNDIVANSFKLWYSVDTTLNAGDELLATRAIVPTNGKILFNCINKIVPKGRIGYFIVSADIESGATIGRTIQITLPVLNAVNPAPANTADVILLTGTKVGTLTPGGVQTIVGANVPPTSADFTVSTRVNTPYTFSQFDFAFGDLNAPDQFSGVFREILLQTTSIPALGATLTYNGVPVTANPANLRIKVADIPNLKFTPAVGDIRTDYARFTFKVYDGRAFSNNSYTSKIDITGDNLFFPAIFTPNSNDVNNVFKLLCSNPSRVADFGLKIYDRNNNLMYETVDLIRMINIGWDGKNKDGVLLPTGAYLWTINGKFADGKDLKINDKVTGVIRLVR